MPNPIFIQDSRVGRTIFEITDEYLLVSWKQLGRRGEAKIELRRLDPDYEPRTARLTGIILRFACIVILCAAVIWGICNSAWIPEGLRTGLLIYPSLFIVGFLIAAFRYTLRLEFYVFKDQWGKPAVRIVREKKQADECAAFIHTLVERIELSRGETSQATLTEALNSAATPNIERSRSVPGTLCRWSIGLGLVGVVLPLIPIVRSLLDIELFTLVFLLCVAAMALGILAIWNREPRRWWGLLGIALGLVPLFFY